MSDETKINPNDSAFSEPIPADLPRRQLDRRILESYDATQERIRNISSRVTRIEATFDGVRKDLARVEDAQKDMAANIETTASHMMAISNRFNIHAEMEEYQWQSVNKAHEVLTQIGTGLNEHLKQSENLSTRIDWVERLMWALWGIVGASAATLAILALKGLGA